MLETFPHNADQTAAGPSPGPTVAQTLVGHPRLYGVQTELGIDHSTEEFERSLHRLIDRVDQLERRPSTGSTPPP